MMKFKNYLMGMATIALLGGMASCQNKDELPAPVPEETPAWVNSGEGFMKIGISLPTVSKGVTRAMGDGYGEYKDGVPNEYVVENAMLLLFAGSGDNEDTYVLHSAYNLSAGGWNNNPQDQITTTRDNIVTKVSLQGVAALDNVGAMVILNHHDFCHVTGNNFYLGITDTPAALQNGKTLAEIKAIQFDETGRRYDIHSFYMTNMPYADQLGGTNTWNPAVKIRTLYPVNRENIYPSEAEAATTEAELAANIHVERALAKVEVGAQITTPETENTIKSFKINSDGTINQTTAKLNFTILGWFVDNTNAKINMVRNLNEPVTNPLAYLQNRATGKVAYRFIDGNWVDDTQNNAARIHWAVDHNYNKHAEDGELVNKGGQLLNNSIMQWEGDVRTGDLRAIGSYYYCTENTFDVFHQSHYNTTRVIVAAKLNTDGSTFYTISNEYNMMFDENAVKRYAIDRIIERVSCRLWFEKYYPSDTEAQKPARLEAVLTDANPGHVTITVKPVASATQASKEAWTLEQANHDNFLASNYTFSKYVGGVAYYPVYIQHFGQNETPWVGNKEMSNTTTGVYGTGETANNNFLGRYGVVRNNWYKLTVEGIRGIGSADVPQLPKPNDPDNPDTPDDEVEQFIKVTINIMPWVMRTQSGIKL